jgi:DNA-binding CsgD family transcriptional regulator
MKVKLKPKELLLVKLVCREFSNVDISKKLGIALRTTEKLKARVYEKTNTDNGIGLFKWALLNGVYKLEKRGTRSKSRS